MARRAQRWITENTPLLTKKRESLFDRWSYSSWGLRKKCPLALKYAYIDKLKQPPVAAMERGTMLHSLAEHYLTGDITGGVPKQLSKIAAPLKVLKKFKPIVEQFWGVSKDFKPMKYGWLVAKTDAAVLPTKKMPVLVVVDHKSGKVYPEHVDQAGLYAAVGFALYPDVEKVEVEFFYIDTGIVVPYHYTRAQLKYQTRYWQQQGAELMAMKKFVATPSDDACRWCGFRSDKKLADGTQGPCSEWRALRNQ